MNPIDSWPYTWFGVWREYGFAYSSCPSITDFVMPTMNATYDKKRLRNYLTTAQIVASTSRQSFPCPFTGQRQSGAISYRTDGRWIWLDDLADYIDRFGVALPSNWLEEIKERNFIPPVVDPGDIEQLQWPPVRHGSSAM